MEAQLWHIEFCLVQVYISLNCIVTSHNIYMKLIKLIFNYFSSNVKRRDYAYLNDARIEFLNQQYWAMRLI